MKTLLRWCVNALAVCMLLTASLVVWAADDSILDFIPSILSAGQTRATVETPDPFLGTWLGWFTDNATLSVATVTQPVTFSVAFNATNGYYNVTFSEPDEITGETFLATYEKFYGRIRIFFSEQNYASSSDRLSFTLNYPFTSSHCTYSLYLGNGDSESFDYSGPAVREQ